jgi:hypothetical protein
VSSGRTSRSLSPKEGKNIDLFYAENVTCKFCRIIKKSDVKYLDLLFVGQCIYIPHAPTNSLTIIVPGDRTPKFMANGSLHTWAMNDAEEIESVAVGVPRIGAGEPTERSARKLKRSGRALKLPRTTTTVLWVPTKRDGSRGMFKRKRPPDEPFQMVNNIQNHVDSIEDSGKFTSSFEIKSIMNVRQCFHSLVSVTVNGNKYPMTEVDLSVVLSVMKVTNKYTNPSFEKAKACTLFANLFLLLMIYPSYWFPLLMGTPSVMESPTRTMEVRTTKGTMFYLKSLENKRWLVTPLNGNATYEYK